MAHGGPRRPAHRRTTKRHPNLSLPGRCAAPALCARALGGRLSVRPPAHRSTMALPLAVGQPAPPPVAPDYLWWLCAWSTFQKACRIRVSMGVWWRRLNRWRGLLLQRYENFYGGLQSMTVCALSSAMSSADGVPGEPSVHGSTSLWYSLTSSAHRTPRYAQLHYGMVQTLKNRKRPHGRLPLYLWCADTETRHSFMAQRAVLMRAPLLSAVQTPHPISS